QAIMESYVKSEHARAEAQGQPWGAEQEGAARARATDTPTQRLESNRIYNWQQADIAEGAKPAVAAESAVGKPSVVQEGQRWGELSA
ncbi:hypothetical protein ACO1KZ_15700, partial [Staphylococcus aureus]